MGNAVVFTLPHFTNDDEFIHSQMVGLVEKAVAVSVRVGNLRFGIYLTVTMKKTERSTDENRKQESTFA